MKTLFRNLCIGAVLLLLWQALIWLGHLPPYILPSPLQVIITMAHHLGLLMHQSISTITETLLGLLLGIACGMNAALLMAYCKPIKRWCLPLLLISQALPTFAIAPLLVVWFGYGIGSKVMITVIMIFFPVASAFYDGLQETEIAWVELATTMQSTKWRTLWLIRVPAALPNLASGIRVATAIAPIGAIVGEWVGSSQGLGFLMLNANARMQIDMMFAALFVIVLFSLSLYFCVDRLLKKLIHWA